ncbi:DUF4244 domain-containing protein [uncultured Pseudokineococcus sp.]|nr:DUF4244 domain-containing protein [uncultured Pseudokineococcus sp.]
MVTARTTTCPARRRSPGSGAVPRCRAGVPARSRPSGAPTVRATPRACAPVPATNALPMTSALPSTSAVPKRNAVTPTYGLATSGAPTTRVPTGEGLVGTPSRGGALAHPAAVAGRREQPCRALAAGVRPAVATLRGELRDVGMATAEYAIATLAACGFAGLLVTLLASDQVRTLLLGIVRRALSVG